MQRARRALMLATIVVTGACAKDQPAATPVKAPETSAAADAVNELLQLDRHFAREAERLDVADALGAMMADDVVTSIPPGVWADGAAGLRTALRANPAYKHARVTWTPIRGGISADGQHGFTYGYMTIHPADSADIGMKYLSYWIKDLTGWKVAAYRRGRRPAGDVDTTLLAPSLPDRLMPPTTDQIAVGEFAVSLRQAEQAFSDEAQVIGLGPAFRKFGSSDAMNMGGPDNPRFILGADSIGAALSDSVPSTPSTVVWKADRVIVASSGDLGITVGVIHEKTDLGGKGYPFFTVWRRPAVTSPWHYIAE